jgi:hypothetical protein
VPGHLTRRAHAAGACFGASVCVAACSACGTTSPLSAAGERQFAANATDLIAQLHQDVVVSSNVGTTLSGARRALQDHSDLYVLLVAYNDFASCRSMLRNAGGPDPRFDRFEASLGSACAYLEQAANLFTIATTHADAGALVSASRTSLKASPLLYRAEIELDAAGGTSR